VSRFAQDTAVEPAGEDRFTAVVTDRWSGFAGNPLGGYVLAVALRALGRRLAPPDPLAVSAFFLERVVPGPVELRTRVLRAGRRTATGEVGVHQDGREALRATATFADLTAPREGPTLRFADPPALPPPDQAVPLYPDGPPAAPTVARQLEYRLAAEPRWRTGRPSGDPRSEFWTRLTGGGDADPFTLPFLVDAAAPAIMELGASGSVTLQLTLYAHRRPTPGWLACRAATRFMTGGYHEEDFEVWDAAGNLIAQSRQLALPRPPFAWPMAGR
jgi:acyl-CoA thioesterase